MTVSPSSGKRLSCNGNWNIIKPLNQNAESLKHKSSLSSPDRRESCDPGWTEIREQSRWLDRASLSQIGNRLKRMADFRSAIIIFCTQNVCPGL